MNKSDQIVMDEMATADEDIACFPDVVGFQTAKGGVHITMGAPAEVVPKLMSNNYALILYMVNKEQFFKRKKMPDERLTKEDADNFAMSFAVWCIGTEGEMYRAAGLTCYQLLEKYKSRPYIDTANPSNQ